jgi:hypothetical protein
MSIDNEIPIDGPSSDGVDEEETLYSSEADPEDAQIIDRYRLDHLYNWPFKSDLGKYFTVVSTDATGTPLIVDGQERDSLLERARFIVLNS